MIPLTFHYGKFFPIHLNKYSAFCYKINLRMFWKLYTPHNVSYFIMTLASIAVWGLKFTNSLQIKGSTQTFNYVLQIWVFSLFILLLFSAECQIMSSLYFKFFLMTIDSITNLSKLILQFTQCLSLQRVVVSLGFHHDSI